MSERSDQGPVPEAAYRSLVGHSLDAILLTAPDGRILDANPEACHLFGCTLEELRQCGRECVVDPADPRLEAALAERARTGRFRGELTLRRWSGESFPAEVATQIFADPSGRSWTSMVIRDLTGKHRSEEALRETEERFRSAFEASGVGMALVSPNGRFLRVNRALCELVGYTEGDLLALTFQEITHPDDLASDLEQAAKLWAGTIQSYALEKRYLRRNGEIVWGLLTASGVRDENDAVRYGIAQVQDITDRKALEARLHELATRDPLTGLVNRGVFLDRLGSALGEGDDRTVAVLFVDLDGFKQVNDAYGHAAGDQLLVELALRIEAVTGPGDIVGRIGGDEFALILAEGGGERTAVNIAHRVITVVKQPIEAAGRHVQVSASVGIAVAAGGACVTEDLLHQADVALYRAKAVGGGRLAVFHLGLEASVWHPTGAAE